MNQNSEQSERNGIQYISRPVGRELWNIRDFRNGFKHRVRSRLSWVWTFAAIVAVGIGFIISILELTTFTVTMVILVVLIPFIGALATFFRTWPVSIDGGQYWMVYSSLNTPQRVINPGLHLIKPIQYIEPYRENHQLQCILDDLPPATKNHLPFKMKGEIRFRYDPSKVKTLNMDDLLHLTDEDIIKDLRNDLFDIQRKIVSELAPTEINSTGLSELREKIETYFKTKAVAKGVRLSSTPLVDVEVPVEVAEAFIHKWAAEPKAEASTEEMKAFFRATNQLPTPEAGRIYRLSSGKTYLRLYGDAADAMLNPPPPPEIPETIVGRWASPIDLISGTQSPHYRPDNSPQPSESKRSGTNAEHKSPVRRKRPKSPLDSMFDERNEED